MTTSQILGALTTALLLGILIGWLWHRLGERRRLSRLVAASTTPQIAELEGQLAMLRSELDDARTGAAELSARLEQRAARCEEELMALHHTLHGRDEEITHLHAELVRRRSAAPEPAPAPAVKEAPAGTRREAAAPSADEPPHDDLKAIFGIGPVIERLLNGAGITTYRQIAGWTAADIEEITGKLSVFPDRIERDKWVQGAKDEHFRKYGERI